MKPVVGRESRLSGDLELNRNGGHSVEQHKCPPTGGRRQVSVNRLMDLRSMVQRPRVL